MTTATTQTYADTSTKSIGAPSGVDYAYRYVGTSTVPLVLLQHFRGNLDNWDPALVDALAAHRRVVVFDNVGVGATNGATPNTVEQMAADAIAFVDAMGFDGAIIRIHPERVITIGIGDADGAPSFGARSFG